MAKSSLVRSTYLVFAAVLLIGGYAAWHAYSGAGKAVQADNGQKRPASAAVPVTVASVTKADFPVYLNGLGTVQGFNTVVVRTRVDGQINKIAFTEGQLV